MIYYQARQLDQRTFQTLQAADTYVRNEMAKGNGAMMESRPGVVSGVVWVVTVWGLI